MNKFKIIAFIATFTLNFVNAAEVAEFNHPTAELSALLSKGLEESDIDQVKKLIDAKADVNTYDENLHESSLHNAVKLLDVDLVNYLLKNNANLEALNICNATPMHYLSEIIAASDQSETEQIITIFDKIISLNPKLLFKQDSFIKDLFELGLKDLQPLPKPIFHIIFSYTIDPEEDDSKPSSPLENITKYSVNKGNNHIILLYLFHMNIFSDSQKEQIMKCMDSNFQERYFMRFKGFNDYDTIKFNSLSISERIKYLYKLILDVNIRTNERVESLIVLKPFSLETDPVPQHPADSEDDF